MPVPLTKVSVSGSWLMIYGPVIFMVTGLTKLGGDICIVTPRANGQFEAKIMYHCKTCSCFVLN